MLGYVIALVVVGGLLFLAASFVFGRGEEMAPALPEGTPVELPDDRLADGDDLRALRLSVAVRGYRMDEVDWLLDTLSRQVDTRDREIARLRSVLHVEPVPLPPGEPDLLTHPAPPGRDEPFDQEADLPDRAAAPDRPDRAAAPDPSDKAAGTDPADRAPGDDLPDRVDRAGGSRSSDRAGAAAGSSDRAAAADPSDRAAVADPSDGAGGDDPVDRAARDELFDQEALPATRVASGATRAGGDGGEPRDGGRPDGEEER